MVIRCLSVAALGLTLLCGCTSTSLRDSFARTKSRLTGQPDPTVPMIGGESVRTELSDEFRTAQKTLKHPEQMMLMHAQLMEDREEYAQARQRYREILTAYPTNIDAAIGLARIEQTTGRTQQAEQILTDLARQNPDHLAVRLAQGRMYSELGRFAAAADCLTAAVDRNPQDQTARYELGVVLARMERYDAALSHLTYAVGESAATYNIGYLLYEQRRYEEATTWFRKALKGTPDERTRAKAAEMLAKISPQPSDSTGSNAIRVAAERRTHNSPSDAAIVPTVSLSRPEPQRLPAALAQPLNQTSVTNIRTASQQTITPSEPDVRSVALPEDRNAAGPPQWHGASVVPAPQVPSVRPAPQPAPQQSPQQPPMWRSRSQ